MAEFTKIDQDVLIGRQPSEEDLKKFAQDGIKSVINLRQPDEPEQPLSPEEEGREAKNLGLQYVHIPVSMKTLGLAELNQFNDNMNRLPRPVLVHCKGGGRAGAMVKIEQGIARGLTGEQTIQEAAKAGIKIPIEAHETIRRYIDKK